MAVDESNHPIEPNGLDRGRLEDRDVVVAAQSGDSRALEEMLDRYRELVGHKARSYYLIGADHEDILQEGMIGLLKAVRDYRGDREASFKAFAELCITRQIITAIKTATRQKHTPLNSYISLDKPTVEAEEPERAVLELLASRETPDPADLVISTEEAMSIRGEFGRSLSGFEAKVLQLYIEGQSYQQISVLLDRHVKSIDNALQRVKRKVIKHRMQREYLARGPARKVG